MISLRVRLVLGAIFVGMIPVPAQTPTPPYLATVPPKLHWIVTFSYIAKSAPDSIASIDTTKVGTTKRVLVKYVDGSSRQYDILGSDCYTEVPSLGLQCLRISDGYHPFPFYDEPFPFTACVSAANFKERTIYQGMPAFHYQDAAAEAWISTETRLPIGADQIGAVKTTYQYLPPPDAIELTPGEQKAIQIQKTAAQTFQQLR